MRVDVGDSRKPVQAQMHPADDLLLDSSFQKPACLWRRTGLLALLRKSKWNSEENSDHVSCCCSTPISRADAVAEARGASASLTARL